MKFFELYAEIWTQTISKKFIDKFKKVFNYKDDDTYCELNYLTWFIEFADMFICESFLDDCIKNKLKNDKAIDFYWEQLEEYMNNN